MEVTDEGIGDGRMLKPLVEEAENHVAVECVLADGACDCARGSQQFARERWMKSS